ncbi:hypothetical protein GOARA_033_00090 [Gordonia araii NBRC 100433]|uniref:Uncharacterized protein n=1 Tax=Gordonia araii NBRC 100433 TaxID=1073574 RepID=G7H033_9ACTN|nr:hypothetical protein GOARA_033_00090 [Gordonia araii NBRC 100433]
MLRWCLLRDGRWLRRLLLTGRCRLSGCGLRRGPRLLGVPLDWPRAGRRLVSLDRRLLDDLRLIVVVYWNPAGQGSGLRRVVLLVVGHGFLPGRAQTADRAAVYRVERYH